MTTTELPAPRRILAAKDRSESADAAVRWAANLAAGYGADLVVLQVLVPPVLDPALPPEEPDTDFAMENLRRFAEVLAGERGHGKVVVNEDPAGAILEAIEDENIDAVVVGNLGMAGRREFLLGNIPNRVSHNARCTVIIVNTSGAQPAVRIIAPAVEPGAEDERLLRRAWRLGRIMARAGLKEILSHTPGDGRARERAVRFREALDAAGPTFAKLGQILSTRPDLVPPEFLEELANLQERVTPLSEAEVVAAMERELRVPWEDVFASIDPQPLAAGTIAEVHRATLESGERVVVKIQRPTAERDIMDDLGLLQMFATRAADKPAFRRVFDLPAIIDHLSTSLRRELDFRQEASNLRRMKEVLRPFSRLEVPEVFESYSTSRLLVMEEVQGTRVSEAPPGPEREEAARQLLESFFAQVMTEGFFHADPHPGNMKWWDGKIYLLDLGMVGEVEPSVRELVTLLLLAFAQEDADFLSEVVLMLASSGKPGENVDLPAFRSQVAVLMGHYRNLPLREIQFGPLLTEITEIAIRNNVQVPTSLMLTGKAFGQMQLAVAELDPDLDPFKVAAGFIMKSTVGKIASAFSPRTWMYEAQKASVRVNRLLEAIEGLVGARPGGNLQVNFRGTERLEETITRSSRQLALAFGMGTSIIATAMSANSEKAPRWVPIALGGLSSTLTASLLAELRRQPKKE